MESFVCIDLGASGNRYTSEQGAISLMANNMVELSDADNTRHLTPQDSTIENALEVRITKEGESDFFPARILIGALAERFSSNNDRPTNAMHKHLQKINYVSAIVAEAISRLKFGTPEEIDLYLAVPPVELFLATDVFNQSLTGKYLVEFPKYLGGATVKLNIKSVKCYAESYMSTVSFFFNMNGTLKEENKKYLVGNMLSLDIGASTTDLAIIKNGVYQDKSGQTYKVGGNMARDFLIDQVRERFGFDLPIVDAEVVMSEGRMQMGDTYVDVKDIVDNAKEYLAKAITNSMTTYFSKVAVPIQTLKGILVSGGGSMQSQFVNETNEVVKTSDPMSKFVTKQLQTICSTVPVIAYGDEARLANLKGLFIRAKMEQFIANKEAQEQAKTAQAIAQAQPVQPVVQNQQTQPVAEQVQQVAQAQPVVEQAQPVVEQAQPAIQI